MFNMNGPPRGSNTTSDQSSYDLIYKDFVISSMVGTVSPDFKVYSYNLPSDNINQLYKAELVAATVKFNNNINDNVKNQALFLSIPQLNGNTTMVAGNIPTGNVSGISNPTYNYTYTGGTNFVPYQVNGLYKTQGNVVVSSDIFCQIPDNCTPLTPSSLTPNNTISLLIGGKMYDCTQYYNPPINKINQLDVSWCDGIGNNIVVDSSGAPGTINSFYFALRIHYFQKRYSGSAFSTSIWNTAGTTPMDSLFKIGS